MSLPQQPSCLSCLHAGAIGSCLLVSTQSWTSARHCRCEVCRALRSYVYEGATNGSSNIASPADRIARTHQPQKEILSLQDYRTRHNQYNTDVGKRSQAAAGTFASMAEPPDVSRWHRILALTRVGSYLPCWLFLVTDTKAMRASAPMIAVWDDHE